VCEVCNLRYSADEPRCPRCQTASPGQPLPAYDFAGFIARRDERPILDEEDRYAVRNLVKVYPQWNGNVVGRWTVGSGWALRLSRNEEVRWVNEGLPPSQADRDQGLPLLHSKAKGWVVCATCGHMLEAPPAMQANAADVAMPLDAALPRRREGTPTPARIVERPPCRWPSALPVA
jgi:hypothetical protein